MAMLNFQMVVGSVADVVLLWDSLIIPRNLIPFDSLTAWSLEAIRISTHGFSKVPLKIHLIPSSLVFLGGFGVHVFGWDDL